VGIFGLLGYLFIQLKMEPAPLLLGYVLGPMMEENLRRSLNLSHGDWSVFITKPVSATILFITVLLVFLITFPSLRVARQKVFVEE
jgi:TctA family transporter